MSLREQWKSVARADRFVYGGAILLIALSFLVHLKTIARHFEPEQLDDHVVIVNSAFRENGQALIVGVAVLILLGWEVAKAGYKALSDSGPVVVGVLVAVPVAAPLTALAAWLAKLFAANIPEDHPLFPRLVPLPISVGVTVYVLTTALVVAALREWRARVSESPET